MEKFRRNYTLTIQSPVIEDQDPEYVVIKPPLTIEFDISRDDMASTNYAQIRVFNLSETNRRKLYKNWISDIQNTRILRLDAGYGDVTPTIFLGTLSHLYSVRQGTDFVTTLDGHVGGLAFMSEPLSDDLPPFAAGTPKVQVLRTLIGKLSKYGITVGAIGDFPGPISGSRGRTPSGNIAQLVQEIAGVPLVIDNNKAYVLKTNECLKPQIDRIDARSGLLGTPVREQTKTTVEILFEPRVRPMQQITLESLTEKYMSEAYKVVSIKHRGTISGATGGSATTTLGLFSAAAISDQKLGLKLVDE